jgi:hypothetical protein
MLENLQVVLKKPPTVTTKSARRPSHELSAGALFYQIRIQVSQTWNMQSAQVRYSLYSSVVIVCILFS